MGFIKKIFKKKSKQTNDVYAYLGSIGISPKHLLMYEEAINKIKENIK